MGSNRKFSSKIAIVFLLMFIWGLFGMAAAVPSSYGNWTRVAENASSTYLNKNYGTVVFHEMMWLIGGQKYRNATYVCSETGSGFYTGGKEENTSEIWSSHDGKTWGLVTENPGFSGRINPGLVVFRDRLWVIGGTGFDDVWSSSDGRTWFRETEHAGFSPRGEMGVVVFHDQLWVIAGGTHYPFPEHANMTDDIWSSADGKSWTRETEHAGFGPRFGYGVVVYKERLWMIDGVSDHVINGSGWVGGGQDVWFSDNGANWTLAKDNLPFGRREVAPVTVFDNKLWIVGGGYRSLHLGRLEIFSGYNDVWSSADGITWTLETNNPGFNPGAGPVVVFKNAIWNIGPDIWSMPLQDSDAESTPSNSRSFFTQFSSVTLPTTIPPSQRTVQVVPSDTDTLQTPSFTSSAPLSSGTTARAGIDGFTGCLNLICAIGTVMMARVIKGI
ncbi:MAG TPA: hypothetical protein PKZ65_04945 [Methanoregulaceae archaeon]|nr:hypothetical protein [Methanoregulaceae archaeon]